MAAEPKLNNVYFDEHENLNIEFSFLLDHLSKKMTVMVDPGEEQQYFAMTIRTHLTGEPIMALGIMPLDELQSVLEHSKAQPEGFVRITETTILGGPSTDSEGATTIDVAQTLSITNVVARSNIASVEYFAVEEAELMALLERKNKKLTDQHQEVMNEPDEADFQ